MNSTYQVTRHSSLLTQLTKADQSLRKCLEIVAIAIATTYAPRATASSIVLYDQTSNQGGILGSQNFTDADIYDCTAADDFVVPAGETWTVTGARIPGGYYGANGPADSFNVTIFSDSGTFPGSTVAAYPNITYSFDGSSFLFEFPTACVLPAGTYWLAIQANMSINLGTWVWVGNLTTINAGCVWENPPNGYGLNVFTFGRISEVAPWNSPDLSFQILGPSPCTDAAISQSASRKTVDGDLEVTYFLAVHNFGPGNADSVKVSDLLPSQSTFVSASVSQGTATSPAVGASGTVVWNIASIPIGQTTTATITVKVTGHGNKTIVNTATLESACDVDADNDSTTLTMKLKK